MPGRKVRIMVIRRTYRMFTATPAEAVINMVSALIVKFMFIIRSIARYANTPVTVVNVTLG